MKDFPKLFVSLALPFIAGGIGSYFTIPSIDSWYSTLNKPFF
ncbi:MAG: tryptophan-rich sensory protein, partial [Candidatus Levybacteria bacterium]|nr:tryptophan-rich sensory protein [Candidatus Levybacteria bacterium]